MRLVGCLKLNHGVLLPFGAEFCVFQFTIQNTKIKIYGTIILSVVLSGCETWSLALKELPRLGVLESEVLRKIFEQKLGDVTG